MPAAIVVLSDPRSESDDALGRVFNALAAAAEGLALIEDNPVPGTSGLPSLRSLVADGHTVLTF